MQNDKLLPCMCCGSDRIIHFKTTKNRGYVTCTDCGMRTRGCGNYEHKDDLKWKERATILWNTRKPMERIVEQLEYLHKYNSEQATLYHDMEKQDAHTREMKDLYIDRANCYGVAIRTVKGGVDNAG